MTVGAKFPAREPGSSGNLISNLKAYFKNNGVELEWSKLMESHIASYSIERSTDGYSFTSIGIRTPSGNGGGRSDYRFFDAHPHSNLNFYRIRIQESSGNVEFSHELTVKAAESNTTITAYPNPVTNHQVTLHISHAGLGKYNLEIINGAGQPVYHNELHIHSTSQTQTINLPKVLAPGIYFLVISNKGYKSSKKLIVE
jgi:hypothetical protein